MLNMFSGELQAHLAGPAANLSYMKEPFKERMKRIRVRAGYKSQGDAAEAIGCDRGTVGMWEAPSSAVQSLSSDWLFQAARAVTQNGAVRDRKIGFLLNIFAKCVDITAKGI